MHAADELIRDIVGSSQIPSEKRRQAVLRELRSHVEDLILAAREAGHSDDDVRKLVLASFGDPAEIARAFAWVYRRERAMLRIAVFVLSTLTAAVLLSVGIIAMQTGIALGFGTPVLRVLASRHTIIEALDILSTVAAYVGFISLERLFDRHRFSRALGSLALGFAFAAATCSAAHGHVTFLAFGFVNGVFLRTIQVFMKNRTARNGLALAWFAVVGLISFQAHPSALHYALVVNCASWLVMGAGYQLMAGLSARIDNTVSSGLQRI